MEEPIRRVFLIHGWEGSPHNHWFPWLSRELGENGFTVFAPAMPNSANPKVSEWIEHLQKVVVNPDEETYFVGHSLGCIATLRFLETLPEQIRVGGCVFVAGFSQSLNIPEIAEFYSLPIDIERARVHTRSIVTVYSDNDEYISLAVSEDFTNKLHATGMLEKGKGHFSSELKKKELPVVLENLLRMANVKS